MALSPSTSPDQVEPWHALNVAGVAAKLGVEPSTGLLPAEAARRLEAHGPNVLPKPPAAGPWRLLLRQFQSLLVYVLLAAALLSLILGDFIEAAAILVIAVLNAGLGFLQEFRAERALEALKSMTAPMASVVRGSGVERIPGAELVPGDVVQLESGDVVPADARIAEAAALATNEAVLTGESLPVEKRTEPVDADSDNADQSSMAFQGTQVVRGHGRAIVVTTGRATEMGKIASQVAGGQRDLTPLERELARAARYLASAAALLCVLVFAVGVLRGIEASQMLLIAASLAVAAIPEGLPAASTIVLALGVQRMAQRHVLVRRLSSVETLGSVSIVFTDKTGTLTENRMVVEDIWVPGEISDLLLVAALCNNASLDNGGSGDPTEVALLAWAENQGFDFERARSQYRRDLEIPFDAERARMTVIVEGPGEPRLALSKGAPDAIVRRTASVAGLLADDAERQRVLAKARSMAETGMRVLALARKSLSSDSEADEIEMRLDLVGLVGLADPLRSNAATAVEQAQAAGVQVVMLTGDQPATAATIAARLGLHGEALTGRDVRDLDLNDLSSRLTHTNVFARVTSEHKLRIIQAAKQMRRTVAMTGDGVNDAPALRAADIGIAMGKAGTDVARETSDMVITDDNFSSIVAAIEEGRIIHANIRSFVHFLLACNVGEILVVFLALVIAGESVLSPLQILYINLLTDGLPALALGVEPGEASTMRERPRQAGARILSGRSLLPIFGIGSLVAIATLSAYALGSSWQDGGLANKLAFATLVGSQLAASLVFRSEEEVFFKLPRNLWLVGAIAGSVIALMAVFYVPPLRDAFDTGSLSVAQWLTVAAFSSVPLIVGELVKASRVLQRLGLASATS